jgi:RimJ/RimL family protein N-acetyltransferase
MSIRITSSRLLIDPVSINEYQFIRELVNTEGWLQFIGNRHIYSDPDAITYVQKIIDDPNVNYWVARLKTNDIPIGIVTFIKRDYLQYPDIGFAFLPQYANSGYAYESTKALLDSIIQTGKHTHISSVTKANNPGSIKLLKKLGLDFPKEIKVNNEELQIYEASADRVFITGVTKSFFSAFTNKGNEPPNLDLLKEICIPEVLITNKNKSNADVFNLSSFIDTRKKLLTDGTLMEFEEKEINAETRIVNHIGTRFSEYEKTGIVYRQRFKMKGNKLFQFVKIKQSWKISSILWEDYES